jgi:hypothetical protein
MNLKHVYEGWKNHLAPEKQDEDAINTLFNYRMSVCKSCVGFDESGEGCTIPFTGPCCNKNKVVGVIAQKEIKGCGCALNAKLKCFACACPVNKWKAVLIEQK